MENISSSQDLSAGPLGPQTLAIGRPEQGLHRRDEGLGWERWVDRMEWWLAVQGGISSRQGNRAREAAFMLDSRCDAVVGSRRSFWVVSRT